MVEGRRVVISRKLSRLVFPKLPLSVSKLPTSLSHTTVHGGELRKGVGA